MTDKECNNIIFCQASIPYGDMGDLVLTKILIMKLRAYGRLIVNDYGVPEWYVQQLGLKDEERASFYKVKFAFLIWLYSIKTLIKKYKTYLILRPGHLYGKDYKFTIKMFQSALFFGFLRLFGVRICRFGTSIESFSKAHQLAEKLRAFFMYFYSVRDSLSRQYALKIGIQNVKLFPDLFWFLEKNGTSTNLKYLMQIPRALKKPIEIDKGYVIFSFRDKFKEFDIFGYKNNIYTALDRIAEVICKQWKMKLVICYQVVQDAKFSKELKERYQESYDILFIEDLIDSRYVHDLYSKASMIFSNRLHVLMLAMLCGTTSVALIDVLHEPKINGIYNDAGLNYLVFDIAKRNINPNILLKLLNNTTTTKRDIDMAFDINRKTGEDLFEKVFKG